MSPCSSHWKARKLADKQASEYKQLRNATGVLQFYVRKWLAKKRIKQQQAAIIIIRCCRTYLVRSMVKKRVRNIVKLQALVRRYLVRKIFLSKKSAAVKIQRFFRCCQLRKLAQQNFEKKKKAAIIVQKYVRCYISRIQFLRTRVAVVKIQATWKAYSLKIRFTKMRCAATLIQNQYRSHRLSLKQRAEYNATKSAVIIIQTYVKQWQARKLAQQIRAARTIQASHRGHVERMKYLQLRNATVLLQAVGRMVLQRSRYLQLCSATVLLQQHIRAYQTTKTQRYRYLCQRSAAIRIQAYYRGHLCRKYVQQARAATTLQSGVRMYLARQQHINHLKVVVVSEECADVLGTQRFLAEESSSDTDTEPLQVSPSEETD